MSNTFPYLSAVSKRTGVTEAQMKAIYELENGFHVAIIKEDDFEKRQKLYEHVYTEVGKYFNNDENVYFQKLIQVKSKIARQFKKDIEGRKLLDVGCGNGSFLYALSKSGIPMKLMYGLDIKAPLFPEDTFGQRIFCFQRNIIKFDLPEQFDVLLLDNVYEHIAPQDKGFFLDSLRKACQKEGKIMMIVPHRMFGPTDFTRIIDDTLSGKVNAQCVHLNETTFGDLMEDLKTIGFTKFTTTVPFIALTPFRNWFPDLRLPASWFAALERNKGMMQLLQSIKWKGKCLFRMEVILIAE